MKLVLFHRLLVDKYNDFFRFPLIFCCIFVIMKQFQHHTSIYTGLSSPEVEASRKQYGSNQLTAPPQKNPWLIFLEKFEDPLIRILVVALLLSVSIAFYHVFGEDSPLHVFLEPLGIFISILLATGVAFWFEMRSEKAFNILNKNNEESLVKVLRNRHVNQIRKTEIVVGDIILLDTGDEIPADGLLRQAQALCVNESSLTGELMCRKSIHPEDFDAEATYPNNIVLRSSMVITGHAIMEVTQVGDATEYGKVYQATQIDDSVKTPLNKQLDWLSKVITRASYIVALIIIIGRTIWFLIDFDSGLSWISLSSNFLQTCMLAVTLIVVAVPEGLPLSVSLSLALSMRRMLSTNNLVRRMHACETMGSVTVICTDKTGTLTQNKMQVVHALFQGEDHILLQKFPDDLRTLITESIALNSTAYIEDSNEQDLRPLGNPTESALLIWLHHQHVAYLYLREKTEIIEQLPFSPQRKYMATVAYSPSLKKRVLYVKGAAEILLTHCIPLEKQSNSPLTQSTLNEYLLSYQQQAMRTLAFAYKVLDDIDTKVISGDTMLINDLNFLGIVGISDPIRPDVPEAIATCQRAGISVKIVTGDTPATARAIAHQIGLQSEEGLITGPAFEALSDEEIKAKISSIDIIARARPMDKARLVRLLQQQNEVVAVTGDGTNDAPALNQAQVGLSMGSGSAVAKEASDITIIDDSFSSISQAVLWGRSLYQNIQRFILFQMTINVSACLIVLLGAFMGSDSPLTIAQMLWVNLIMDTFAAMALASLPPSPKVMKASPRRPNDFIINKQMRSIILSVGILFFLSLLALVQVFNHNDISATGFFTMHTLESIDWTSIWKFDHTVHGLNPYELSIFFTIFVMMQFWNIFNARSLFTNSSALLQLHKDKMFLSVLIIILIGQIIIIHIGQQTFQVQPIQLLDWIWIIVLTSIVLWIGELVRFFLRKRQTTI